MTRCLPLITVFLLVVASTAVAADDQWTRFRGPNGTGISHATSVPIEWTEEDYNWKTPIPGVGHSSPVVWNDRILLTAADAETARQSVFCVDTSDGRLLWSRDYPARTYRQHGHNNYASATPAVDADGVVVTWTTPDEIVLTALDHEGRDVWRRELGPYVGARGSGASPIIVGDSVILASDQEDPNKLPENQGRVPPLEPVGKSFVIALDRATGQTRWRLERQTGIAAYSTPCVYQPRDGAAQLVLTSSGCGLTGLNLATGKPVWELDSLFPDRCVASPVVAKGTDGDLILGGYGRGMRGSLFVAVRPGRREQGQEASVAYELTSSVPLVPTPLVIGDRLLLWGDDGVVTALRAATAEVIWRERVGGSYYASPVCINNRVYGVARDGEVVVLGADDRFNVLARNSLNEPVFATPAVSDGVLYFRTHHHLISLGGKKNGD